MYKKLFISFLFIVFIFLLPSLIFTTWNYLYKYWNLLYANKINENLDNYFDDFKIKMMLWNYHYRFWEYENFLEKYNKVDCEWDKNCFNYYHNLWNTLYYYWKDFDNDDKLEIWKSSIYSYLKALTIKQDKKTVYNYEYVLEKLKQLMDDMWIDYDELEDSDSFQDEKINNGSWEWDIKQEEYWDEGQKEYDTLKDNNKENWDDENPINYQERQYSMWLWWEEEEAFIPLSEDEKEYLEKYLEDLKQEELNNMHLNIPSKQENLFDIFNRSNFYWNSNW